MESLNTEIAKADDDSDVEDLWYVLIPITATV